jgi:hypothetical protein
MCSVHRRTNLPQGALRALGRLEDRVAASGWLWDERASLRVDWLLVAVEIDERAA